MLETGSWILDAGYIMENIIFINDANSTHLPKRFLKVLNSGRIVSKIDDDYIKPYTLIFFNWEKVQVSIRSFDDLSLLLIRHPFTTKTKS